MCLQFLHRVRDKWTIGAIALQSVPIVVWHVAGSLQRPAARNYWTLQMHWLHLLRFFLCVILCFLRPLLVSITRMWRRSRLAPNNRGSFVILETFFVGADLITATNMRTSINKITALFRHLLLYDTIGSIALTFRNVFMKWFFQKTILLLIT